MEVASQAKTARQILGANLRRERKARRLSQEAFGFNADLHRTYIGAIERAEKNVSIDNIEKVARALGFELWQLLRPE